MFTKFENDYLKYLFSYHSNKIKCQNCPVLCYRYEALLQICFKSVFRLIIESFPVCAPYNASAKLIKFHQIIFELFFLVTKAYVFPVWGIRWYKWHLKTWKLRHTKWNTVNHLLGKDCINWQSKHIPGGIFKLSVGVNVSAFCNGLVPLPGLFHALCL